MNMRSVISLVLSATLLVSTMPASAAMVSTDTLLAQEARTTQLEQVQGFMARDDVRSQMEALGVDATLAAERVSALTDTELQQLSQNIQDMPAGSSAVELVLVVFLILLLLELVGAINIFSRI